VTQPRAAALTINIIDQYCSQYQKIFPEVRSYEAFKRMLLGIITPSQRKSLTTIGEIVGLKNSQSLHNFISESPWSYQQLRAHRLSLTKEWLKPAAIDIIIDETGDRKKGSHTDYVARQYLGRLGKVDNGIVSVNIYGVKAGITFPLIFEIYKPKSTLKSDDIYQSKPQIAAKLVTELVELGFNIRYVLADSLYGESPTAVLRVLEKLNLQFMVSIRSNHGVWMPDTAKVRQTKWRKFTRTFAAHPPETRYVREVIFGQRGRYTYWDLTTDTKTLPPNSTSYVMTNISSIKSSEIGNIYGERTWVEYGFRQCKSELGWSDFRLTKYSDIARWWEIISCAFLLVSFQSLPATISESIESNIVESELKSYLSKHPNWDEHQGWKSAEVYLKRSGMPASYQYRKVWREGLEVAMKVKGFQGKPHIEWLKQEHPFTAVSPKSDVHANHNEAQNSSLRRRASGDRRRQNLYAKTVEGLQRVLNMQRMIHN
jgi:SRSO17 transposase